MLMLIFGDATLQQLPCLQRSSTGENDHPKSKPTNSEDKMFTEVALSECKRTADKHYEWSFLDGWAERVIPEQLSQSKHHKII